MIINNLQLLNYKEYDFPETNNLPKLHYIIATSHRSGSNWLSLALWKTGCLGAPHEYFNERLNFQALATRFNAKTHDEYVRQLYAHRASPNGIFGVKILQPQWPFAKPFVDQWTCPPSSIKIIHLVRKDIVAQSVSLAKAYKTQRWTQQDQDTFDQIYDPQLIKYMFGIAIRQNMEWIEIFSKLSITPLRISYEDMMIDIEHIIHRIAKYLGIEIDTTKYLDVWQTTRQSDEISIDWINRFNVDEREFIARNAPEFS